MDWALIGTSVVALGAGGVAVIATLAIAEWTQMPKIVGYFLVQIAMFCAIGAVVTTLL